MPVYIHEIYIITYAGLLAIHQFWHHMGVTILASDYSGESYVIISYCEIMAFYRYRISYLSPGQNKYFRICCLLWLDLKIECFPEKGPIHFSFFSFPDNISFRVGVLFRVFKVGQMAYSGGYLGRFSTESKTSHHWWFKPWNFWVKMMLMPRYFGLEFVMVEQIVSYCIGFEGGLVCIHYFVAW